MPAERTDLPRIILTVLFLGLILVGAFWVLKPFLSAILWAAMIVIATWPALETLQRWLGGRRKLAVAALTLALLVVFVMPLFLAVGTLVANTDRIAAWAKDLVADGLPPAPGWIARVPLVGGKAADAWNQVASSQLADLAGRLAPHLGDLAGWFAGQVGGLGKLLVQFLLTVIVSAVFWSGGEAWAEGVLRFTRRLGGAHGEAATRLAGQAVRGVALGVVGTALIQTALAGIGLAVTGIPAAGLLTVVIFVLCIAQLGPLLVLLPVVVWLFWSGAMGWGVVLLVWSVAVGTLDNVLRPVLIRKGADLPLLLIFAGVLGGLMSFGLVGLFVGPVVLAVAHTLLRAWTDAGFEEVPGAPAKEDPR